MPKEPEGKVLRLHKDGIDYTLLRPAYPSDVFVDHYLVAKGYPDFPEERVFPNNEIELFFNLGDVNNAQLLAEEPNFAFATSVLSGLRSSYMRIFPGKLFYIAGIRFTLFGFYHLFKIPATELLDVNYQADEVLGKEIRQFRQRLGELSGEMNLMNYMVQWVQRRMDQDFFAARAWKKIDLSLRDPSFLIKRSLPDLLGYSHKHSVHLVTKMCGLSPKMVHRIYRLKTMFSYPGVLADPSWSHLTYDFGFSDQSHLIREFKVFTGYTPTEFLESSPKDFELKQLR